MSNKLRPLFPVLAEGKSNRSDVATLCGLGMDWSAKKLLEKCFQLMTYSRVPNKRIGQIAVYGGKSVKFNNRVSTTIQCKFNGYARRLN